LLTPVGSEDRARLHAIFTLPGVRHFLFDDEVLPPARTAEIVDTSVKLRAERGLGLWIAEPSAPSDPSDPSAPSPHSVGFGGFWFFREPPELELLYGVVDDEVGRGYGREIASALIHYGFETLHMSAIRASCDAAHRASRRVLDALGFSLERVEAVGGLATAFYEMRPKGASPFSVSATRP
jgi:ribosomal-protein-alanine N-acetyltransferase